MATHSGTQPVGLNPTLSPLHPHFFPPLVVESDAAYPLCSGTALLGSLRFVGSTSDFPSPAPPAHRNKQRSEAQIKAYLTDVPGWSHARI